MSKIKKKTNFLVISNFNDPSILYQRLENLGERMFISFHDMREEALRKTQASALASNTIHGRQ